MGKNRSIGICEICHKPILMTYDKGGNGRSERYQDTKTGKIHHKCIGGKTLYETNKERKQLEAAREWYRIHPFATRMYMSLNTKLPISYLKENWDYITG